VRHGRGESADEAVKEQGLEKVVAAGSTKKSRTLDDWLAESEEEEEEDTEETESEETDEEESEEGDTEEESEEDEMEMRRGLIS